MSSTSKTRKGAGDQRKKEETKKGAPKGLKSCRFFPLGLPLFLVALISPFVFLHFWAEPTAEQWNEMHYFVLVEVPKNLYLVFLPTALLFYFLQGFKMWFWILLSALGMVNLFRFLCHYFLPQAMLTGIIPAIVVEKLALTSCVDSGCSIITDLIAIAGDPEKGAQIWIDDAAWVYIVSVVFILVETGRYYNVYMGMMYILLAVALGFDTVLPLFFIILQQAENTRPVNGQSKLWVIYWLLGIGAVCSWMPNLYGWVIHRGTVAGQLEAGCELGVGARATWAIMNLSFSFGFLAVPQSNITSTGSPIPDAILSWLLRGFLIVLISSNVAAAMATFLMFRELVGGSFYGRQGRKKND